MSRFVSIGALVFLLCVFIGFAPVRATEPTRAGVAVPTFAPDSNTAWVPDRPTGDEFLQPEGGPGPVVSEKDHPYRPNGQGQSTFRVADLSNPILKPWAVDQMRKANQEVLAGRIPR